MNKLELENKILSLIELNQGMKGQDLIIKLMSFELNATRNELFDIIFDMIQEGEIVEIEYVMNGMSKSFLVPRNTLVNIMRRK